jgi:hypothetical protein
MAVKVLIQGMRRSGTTIFFDLFFEDERFDCHYEPLNTARPAPGGGSGAHDYDFMEKTRQLRAVFLETEGCSLDPDAFNYGAPREPRLEYETEFPEYIRRYLRFLLDRADHTLIEFTRAMHKIAELRALAPGGFLIHVVRDPRLVATSYLFGKHQKNRHRFDSADRFFGRTTNKLAWSSYNFSELLLARPEYAPLRSRCTDLMRLLLLWGAQLQGDAQGRGASVRRPLRPGPPRGPVVPHRRNHHGSLSPHRHGGTGTRHRLGARTYQGATAWLLLRRRPTLAPTRSPPSARSRRWRWRATTGCHPSGSRADRGLGPRRRKVT